MLEDQRNDTLQTSIDELYYETKESLETALAIINVVKSAKLAIDSTVFFALKYAITSLQEILNEIGDTKPELSQYIQESIKLAKDLKGGEQ